MFGPPTIPFEGKYYSLVRWHELAREPGLGTPVRAWEAERVLRLMMRDDFACGRLRSAFCDLSSSASVIQHSNETVVRWLIQTLEGMGPSVHLVVRDSWLPRRVEHRASDLPSEVREALRIDALLRELGEEDLSHRGEGYRIARLPQSSGLSHRSTLEVVSERDAKRVLEELAQDARRSAREREVFSELLQALENGRDEPDLTLLVLRRYRFYVRAAQGEVITPSQMRKATEEHWVEVFLIDDQDVPIVGQRFAVTTADGQERAMTTDSLGFFRLDKIPAGQCQFVLASGTELEAPEKLGHLDLEFVNHAGLPISDLPYEVFAGEVSIAKGQTDATGRVHLGGLPPGPYELVLADVAVEAASLADGSAAHGARSGGRGAQQYTVQKGDTLNKIAHQHGLKSGKDLYNAPENEALRKKRPNPDRIRPGDEVNIPGGDLAAFSLEEGQVARVTIERPGEAVQLTLRLLGQDEKPLAGAHYQISSGTFFHAGELDGDGVLRVELPPNTGEARLVVVGDGTFLEQDLHFVDETDDVVADQIRLANLGWYGGEIDGKESSLLAAAVGYYRNSNNLGPGGQMEDATRKHVEQEYLV